MKTNQSLIEEVTALLVICRLTNQTNPIHVAQHCLDSLDGISAYGEITGLKRSSVLKNDTGAYGFIKLGLTHRVLKMLTPLTPLISHSETLNLYFLSNFERLNKQFDKKVSKIEKKFPQSPNHMKHRVQEARVVALIFLDGVKKLIDELLKLFHMAKRQYAKVFT